MSGQLKGKEIIITARKFDSKLKGEFDYITDVKRYSSLNSNRVVIITGDGKGKTTGALGIALIERMKGKKAYIFHFLKNKMGLTEDKALLNIDGFESIRLGRDESDYTWITQKGPDKKDVELVREGLQLVSERIKLFQNSLIVLDEVLFAVSKRLVDEKDAIKLIREKSPQTILLLTGHGENNNIFQNANKIFIMEKIKHPYDDKVPARKGIEY